MIKRTSRNWIPFWGDKWLFGSMRQEFNVAERGIWWDLMAIAMKDEGFIRANEDTPYPTQQLAGMLIVPEGLLEKTIEKFIEKGKYTRLKNGTLYVTNWNKYCFTDRHMRRFDEETEDTMSGNEDKVGAVADTREEKNRLDKNRKDNKYTEEFSQFWNYYNFKVAKKDALKAFRALRRKGEAFDNIMGAAKGYFNHLKNEKVHSNFEKAMMYPATFLRNEKYKDFLGVKYSPPM